MNQTGQNTKSKPNQSQSSLAQLSKLSQIVVDSANLEEIDIHNPIDATTNPSSVLAAISTLSIQNQSSEWLQSFLNPTQMDSLFNSKLNSNQAVDLIYDSLLVGIAEKILKRIQGYVSIEVDAELAYDSQKTLSRSRQIIQIAKENQLDTKRILIKIASTWQGIEAARVLENEGLKCNLTLIFNIYQALACAHAGAFTISPFVCRVLDWYKKNHPTEDYSDANDEPGVQLVREIYQIFKQQKYQTIVMAASFRNTGEIRALAGCDKLTIHPKLLTELANSHELIQSYINRKISSLPKYSEFTSALFDEEINQDPMAKELLANGVANFAKDTKTLKQMILQVK